MSREDLLAALASRRFPTIVRPHGGPSAPDTVSSTSDVLTRLQRTIGRSQRKQVLDRGTRRREDSRKIREAQAQEQGVALLASAELRT